MCCLSVIHFLDCLELFFRWSSKRNCILYHSAARIWKDSCLSDLIYRSLLYFSYSQANITLPQKWRIISVLLSGAVGVYVLGVQSKMGSPNSPLHFVNWKIKTSIEWGSNDGTCLETLSLWSLYLLQCFLVKCFCPTAGTCCCLLFPGDYKLSFVKDTILPEIEFTSVRVAWPSPCSKD